MANLLSSSVQTHSGGLSAYWGGVIATNVTKDNYKCFSITNNTSNSYGDGFIANGVTLTSGTTYFVSGYIYVPAGSYFTVRQRDNTSGGGHDGVTIKGNNAWQYFSYTFSCGSTMTNGQIEGFECDSVGGNKHYSTSMVYYIRDLKLEISKRNNILFTTKHQVLCNEFDETTTIASHLPFTNSDGYTISAAELIERDSVTNVKYDSNKKFTCKELVEGNITDYISMGAPTLTWTSGVSSGTLNIKNNSSAPATVYYGTSSTISSITSGGYALAAGESKDVSITSNNNTYYAYAKNTDWNLNTEVSSGKNCKLTLSAPTISANNSVGKSTVTIKNNDTRTSVTLYYKLPGQSSYSTTSVSANSSATVSSSCTTGGTATAYVSNASYLNSSKSSGSIKPKLAKPTVSSNNTTITVTNKAHVTATISCGGSTASVNSGSSKTFTKSASSSNYDVYAYATNYTNSDTTPARVLYGPVITSQSNAVRFENPSNGISVTVYYKLPGQISFTKYGTLSAGSYTNFISYSSTGTVTAYFYSSSYSATSGNTSKDVKYTAPSTTRK